MSTSPYLRYFHQILHKWTHRSGSEKALSIARYTLLPSRSERQVLRASENAWGLPRSVPSTCFDSTLTEIDCGHLQPIEVMSRVFSSGWVFRLWTLNEANLASELCIKFRDKTIKLGQVLEYLSPLTKPETYHFTGELDNEYGKTSNRDLGTSRRRTLVSFRGSEIQTC